MADKNSLLEFPTDETKEKVQWTKGHDFMDGTPRYTFEGRDPATTYERFQVVIYTEWNTGTHMIPATGANTITAMCVIMNRNGQKPSDRSSL